MSKEDTAKAVGELLTGDFGRDAIHVAVAPVEAGEKVAPGQRIRVGKDGKAFLSHAESIGIVDPFLSVNVQIGERFFIFLYPGTITSLRHEWVHPAFGDAVPQPPQVDDPKVVARRGIQRYADSIHLSYDELMEEALGCLEHDTFYTWHGVNTPDEAYAGVEEFWSNYEIVTGTEIKDKKKTFFNCSC